MHPASTVLTPPQPIKRENAVCKGPIAIVPTCAATTTGWRPAPAVQTKERVMDEPRCSRVRAQHVGGRRPASFGRAGERGVGGSCRSRVRIGLIAVVQTGSEM